MIEFYNSNNNKVSKIAEYEPGCLIYLLTPDSDEISFVEETCKVDKDYLTAALDIEERSRIEQEYGNTLIVINSSFEKTEDNSIIYETLPVGIITTPENVILVATSEVKSIKFLTIDLYKGMNFQKRGRFVMQMIYNIAILYLSDLRKIDQKIDTIEAQLYEKMSNEKLAELLKIEKTLVYYNTALSDNTKIMKKLMRGRYYTIYEEDEDLIEDTIIELEQAHEMAKVNAEVLRSMLDAFSSMISNNLNSAMKTLASITIILTVPMVISSFFGMNVMFGATVKDPWFVWFLFAVSLLLTGVIFIIMKRKNLV